MLVLLLTMLERLGIIVTIAFVLTRFKFFQDMIYQNQLRKSQQLTAIVFFGIFGIIGTYLGVTLNTETSAFNRIVGNLTADEAIANSRVIGIVIAGLLGGYRMGIGAGLIAGIHRFTLGGFTGLSCGLAAIITGIISGAFYKRNKKMSLTVAFSVGALAETAQMGIILLLATPFEKAFTLVEVIGIPMILANGIGSALFLLIIKNVVNEKDKAGALQAQKSLRIADQTITYLRKGINNHSALAVCQILYREMKPSAVAMTNNTNILAHVGLADDHHRANSPLQTDITRDVIHHGELVVVNGHSIHCVHKDCPLGAAVIAPLKQRGKTIGTIKFYFKTEKEITSVIKEVISGLSVLLSNQLEVAEADRAYQLAKEAEIKALQAQISPHFLFNSLNTVVSLIRIEPTKARKLLISLSNFLRQNLTGTTADMISIEQELNHVKAYLTIEEARFIDRLKVVYDIDENVLSKNLPPLTLQPLVENAIKHGLKDKDYDCLIKISIKENGPNVKILVVDNGLGISTERLKGLGTTRINSKTGTGLGLYNVNRRLCLKFGDKAALKIKSETSIGTELSFIIPKTEEM
ncbi:sensor histidine kinase [Aquibacillus rhizosphaerae]|uniref:histidine kinase n=1 Tax=Aquibacillus rhizosphaerae TaxID=3051431 RepID=A0ABT7LA02_9BACI|nr:sensor histidine kinase [Aquibacillus sp. LR5S19]MDL4842701.1 sensor histidine kinase [Aquibacillus sp. LR5S19]